MKDNTWNYYYERIFIAINRLAFAMGNSIELIIKFLTINNPSLYTYEQS